jgi:hypothetical protein
MNCKARIRNGEIKIGFALLMVLAGWLMTSCGREGKLLRGGRPGVTVENNTELLVALPIENVGETDAHDVKVHEVELRGGHRDVPVTLPVDLGTIAADGRRVIQLRFSVAGLDVSKSYELEAEGRYRGRRDRDGDDEEREWKFRFETKLQIPPQGPGSATVKTNHGATHRTEGPYPELPQPVQREKNENLPPTPENKPQVIFPKTPKFADIKDPQIGSYPGVAQGGAVGFVINTQNTGVANSFPPDPSGADSGGTSNVVLNTGNVYLKYSTDGGKTFKTISNFSTVFGDSPDGGYCCDQVVHYIPSMDLIVWSIQTNQPTDAKGNVTGGNRQRVAWAKPSAIAANFYTAWTWFDVTSGFLGLGSDWLDFPDLSTANGHLYLASDDVTKGGLVVTRISFADMQLPPGNTVGWDFTDPTKSTNALGSHLAQNANGTMFWAGHNGTGKMTVSSWGDTSSQYNWRDVSNTTYSTSDYTSKAPDGQYWLDPRIKADSVLGAVVKPFVGLVAPGSSPPANQIWFAWTAGRDSNFKQPYVRMLFVDDQNFNNVGEFETWNSDYVFAYPALAANSQTAEVAMSLMWGGGGNNYMNHAAGFPQDFLLYITTASNVTFTANPANVTPVGSCNDASGGVVSGRCTRSGDYLSLRRVGNSSGLFGTVGYEVDLVDSTKSTDCLKAPGSIQNERWVIFGRSGDVSPTVPTPPR